MILYKRYQTGGPLSYDKSSDTYWGGNMPEVEVEGKNQKKPYYTADFDQIIKDYPITYKNDNLAAIHPDRVKMIQHGQMKERDLALANSAAEKILKKNPRKKGEEIKEWVSRLTPEEKGYVMKSQYGAQFNPTVWDRFDSGLNTLEVAGRTKSMPGAEALNIFAPLDYSTNIVRAGRNAVGDYIQPETGFTKSAWGNNGRFDMSNPNIYKAILPPVLVYSLQNYGKNMSR